MLLCMVVGVVRYWCVVYWVICVVLLLWLFGCVVVVILLVLMLLLFCWYRIVCGLCCMYVIVG